MSSTSRLSQLESCAFLAFAYFMLTSATAWATQVFNEDLQINDPTPGLTFNDTDNVSGPDWYARGRTEYFAVVHVGAMEKDILHLSTSDFSVALGWDSAASGDSSLALGAGAVSAGTQSSALGFEAMSAGELSTALGPEADSDGAQSIALGYGAHTIATGSMALGRFSVANDQSSAAMGDLAAANSLKSTSLGYSAITLGQSSTALGANARTMADFSTAIGARAYTSLPNTVVIGSVPGVNTATNYANVGMGTTMPDQAVAVERSAAAARFQLTSFTNTTTEAPQYIQRRARGTSGAPAAVQNGDNLGLFSFRGYNGTAMGGSRATITAQAAGNFTNSSTPTRLVFAVAPSGSTAPQQVMVIENGQVKINGQNLNVPDYVFEDDYELMPLQELQAFIDANGHLPGIASADEVSAEGHDLAGSDMAHLRKIEELTLYTLQQQARIEQLEARDRERDQEVAALKTLSDEVAALKVMLNGASGATTRVSMN